MKSFILSADVGGQICGPVFHNILNLIPDLVKTESEADVCIVPISYFPNYKFNPALNSISKPYVLVDFLEFGWDCDCANNMLGKGIINHFGHLNTDEYGALDHFVYRHPPGLTLKRELSAFHQDDTHKPIDWPCCIPMSQPQTKAGFESRPIEVFSSWGLSHPLRSQLHGDIFRGAHEHGYTVADHWEQWGHLHARRIWATIHSPHYARRSMGEVMNWNHASRISVSLWGAGKKCFRHTESPNGSVMALQTDTLAWSFPWVDGKNCVRLTPGDEFQSLLDAVRRGNLYDIYVAGQETLSKYCSQRYVSEYVTPLIEAAL